MNVLKIVERTTKKGKIAMVDFSWLVYFLTSAAALYGFGLFVWWWNRLGKATKVYVYITLLFLAVLFEKSIFAALRSMYLSNDPFVSSPLGYCIFEGSAVYGFISIPLLIILVMISSAMTIRIIKTKQLLKSISNIQPKECANKVLVVTNNDDLNIELRGVFLSNSIAYFNKSDFLEALELLVASPDISVVLFDLENTGNNETPCEHFVKMVRKERPWTILVAMTYSSSISELIRVRRAYFDDYFQIPIDEEVLLNSFKSWVTRINRWRTVKYENHG
jgi:CheY-like chemotaxis protein